MKENSKRSQTGLEIAVIGMSGKFPGANDIYAFWENLKNGVESITFFSDEELVEAGIDREILEKPDYVKAKGCIADLDCFDASFFKYTPNEAAVMDPQLRLFHQSAWHALEDAGYDPQTYKGLIGLYAGYTSNILWKVGQLFQLGNSGSETFEAMNLNSDYFATLICYKLNLKGPGITVNTACSTSLVAIHLACRALITGEADITMAGGVTLTLPWKGGYFYQEGMIMSPDGHCRPFDVKAKGTTSGNGIAIVVLKRLVKAIKEGDHIYAVIKGTAINNDGSRKVGYTALSVEAQSQVIRAAQRMAETEPESITYIETHGIGTQLGDPLEIEALKKAFSKTTRKKFCRLGFLKPNIGHMDAAIGAASFIKTVMALKHRLFPPALNFTSLNPQINLEDSPFYIGNNLETWQTEEGPRRAGVSSFGIGGTNAHVILEEWPENETTETGTSGQGKGRPELLLLSAKSKTALARMSANLAAYLKENPGINLANIAYTLQAGRSAFNYRYLSVCPGKDEAIDSLLSLTRRLDNADAPLTGIEAENPPVVFMFPGPGSQYTGMGREFYDRMPVFAQETDRCLTILKSLSDKSDKSDSSDRSDQFNQSNSSDSINLFIFEYALAKLLMHWGIEPQAMMGDNTGEYTAACLAGVFPVEDALKLLLLRERVLREAGQSLTAVEDQVKQLTLQKPTIPLISNVTRKWISPEDAVNPRYWSTQLKQLQPCADGLRELVSIENAVLVEVGPGMTLSDLVRSYPDSPLNHPPVPLAQKPDREGFEFTFLLKQLGQLWLLGIPIDWNAFYSHEKRKRVSLPGYPFDRVSYTIEQPLHKLGLIAPGGKIAAGAVSTSPTAHVANRPELKTPYLPPRNRVEEILVQMWEDLLGIRPIGIHDDLMELGGNSLKGLTFVNRFKEQWGAIIHIATVFSSPTAAELAEYLNANYPGHFDSLNRTAGEDKTALKEGKKTREGQISIALSENLMLLKEISPEAGNLFLIHEVSGDVGAYIEFSRLLDIKMNCWGIQSDKLKNYLPQNKTIEEIAAFYIQKIKKMQPEGPYYLFTWSGGGPIVFEMALQLEQQGDTLGLLAFIDCRGPVANNQYPGFNLETEKAVLKGFFSGTPLVEKLENIRDVHRLWPEVVEELKANTAYRAGLEAFIKQDPMLTLLNFEGQRVEDLIQYLNLSRTFKRATDYYNPSGKLQAPIHFFEGTEAPQEVPLNWHKYCAQPLVLLHMKGDHYSIFKRPDVVEFAQLVSQVITAAQGAL